MLEDFRIKLENPITIDEKKKFVEEQRKLFAGFNKKDVLELFKSNRDSLWNQLKFAYQENQSALFNNNKRDKKYWKSVLEQAIQDHFAAINQYEAIKLFF